MQLVSSQSCNEIIFGENYILERQIVQSKDKAFEWKQELVWLLDPRDEHHYTSSIFTASITSAYHLPLPQSSSVAQNELGWNKYK